MNIKLKYILILLHRAEVCHFNKNSEMELIKIKFPFITQSNKFKSDYFELCSPLLATKIEGICCTTWVVIVYNWRFLIF